MNVSVVLPALNEEAAVGRVLQAIPRNLVAELIVVDNGSTDRTAEVAADAGARVVRAAQRGYGAACLAGTRAAQGDIVAYLDADGSFEPCEIGRLIQPLQEGRSDLVLGSRELGQMTDGAMPAHQRFGNRLAVTLLRALYRLDVTDLGPFRAGKRDQLLGLGMTEMTYGWPIEMMIRAARRGYRLLEVPVSYRARVAGQSKVSGTLKGSALAAYRICATIVRQMRTVKEDEANG